MIIKFSRNIASLNNIIRDPSGNSFKAMNFLEVQCHYDTDINLHLAVLPL